jgi:hypothetical protein
VLRYDSVVFSLIDREGSNCPLPHNNIKERGIMIKRLNYENAIDVLEFIKRVNDLYEDFYLTKEKNRLFLDNLFLINKVLNSQEMYALTEKETKGLLLIYRQNGYRPYIKILADNQDSERNLIKYLIWNFSNQDLYIKLKKKNPLTRMIQRYGFVFAGDRGQEILLFRKGEKYVKKIEKGDDDEYRNK